MSELKHTTSALIPFQFKNQNISVLTNDDGEPWFIAKEVCEILGIRNVSNAVGRLDSDEKSDGFGIGSTDTGLIINELGLYSLVLKSRKKEAKVFQRWVTHDVLPAIRKTGKYSKASTALDHYPELRAITELAVGLAEARDEAAVARQEAAMAIQVAQHADTKSDMALDEAHRMTLEEFVVKNGLLRQFPESQWPRMARWLTHFCQQYNLAAPKVSVAGKSWDGEKSYPLQALAALQRYELKKPRQVALAIRKG